MCEWAYQFCYKCQNYTQHQNGVCLNCNFCNYPYQNKEIQFNYECPNCHGKFNTPALEDTGETKLVDIKEIGTPTIVAQKIQPILRYKCPFCGITMVGL